MKKNGNGYNVIDLFCGCGGLSKGFENVGYNVILGIDNDDAALNTFQKNHKNSVKLNADLSKQETFDIIRNSVGSKSIDLIVGGPPCQGFSLTGPRNFDDPRNKLYLAVFEMVKIFSPKAFVIENVPGMATLYNGEIKSEIVRRFDALGYNVSPKILCAADYGVPQIRKRLFFVGLKKSLGTFEFPQPSHNTENYITCADAISDLPSREDDLGEEHDFYTEDPKTDYQKLMRKFCSELHNHVATKHTEYVRSVIRQVPPGGNYKDLPPNVGESRRFNEAWTRYDGQKPSRTIDTGHRNHFHYKYDRVPTIRENARLQSFPDDFIFYGTRTQQNRQVGNAVPPLLGSAIACKLLEYLPYNDLPDESPEDIKKINTIDLFAGCGGFMEGFESTGLYETLACVEWEKAPCDNLVNRLKTRWGYNNAESRVLRFDIQRTSDLLMGWVDPEYGMNQGLNKLVGQHSVDLIIGGPPCQAYSLAGRVRDEKGMKEDYRNYLFESYLRVVNHFKPKMFVFENVPGMLSAAPDGELIVDKIRRGTTEIGYKLIADIKNAVVDLTEFGVPQNRKRVIILGVNEGYYQDKADDVINKFYDMLKQRKTSKMTVRDAIGDLPAIYPLDSTLRANGRKFSHSSTNMAIMNHVPRFHSDRDIRIFRMLAKDIQEGHNQYTNVENLKELYSQETGKQSNVHKYYVLRWNEQSNTIPAHLYKDGLRHIHPDPEQARSITVREAARLQTFADDYEFLGSMVDQYKMIGNAVPPRFSHVLALILEKLLSLF